MCNNISKEQTEYFDKLASISVHILEGMSLADAVATQNMTSAQFLEALDTDIRKVNYETYQLVNKALNRH